MRAALGGTGPVFAMPNIAQPGAFAIVAYVLLGAVVGAVSVVVTKAVYRVEDAFEKLPVHWMWWPAIGAVAVGAIGYFAPRTLGVGYTNIEDILSGKIAGAALVVLFVLKLVSWSIALGSGTSGGTLAPLFTIGGGVGAALGALLVWAVPGVGVDQQGVLTAALHQHRDQTLGTGTHDLATRGRRSGEGDRADVRVGDKLAAGLVAFDNGEGAIRRSGVAQCRTDDRAAAGRELPVTGVCLEDHRASGSQSRS